MKKRSPGRWSSGGSLMLLGSIMVQYAMRPDAHVGVCIWFDFTAALGAGAILWGLTGLMRPAP